MPVLVRLLLTAFGVMAALSAAAGERPRGFAVEQTLRIQVERGQLLRLARPAGAVFLAAPDVADLQVHAPDLVYVFGKRVGTTTLYAVDEEGRPIMQARVVVEHDLPTLRALLARLAPDAELRVESFRGGLLLEGTLDSPRLAQEIAEVASGFLGEGERLINRIRIEAPLQVNLRVRVAEVSREVLQLLGVNWDSVASVGDFVFGLSRGRVFRTPGGTVPLTTPAGVAGAVLAGVRNGDVDVNAMLDALEQEGLVTILAEPNLTAISGETASFLAGGEFPVPVGVENGEISIEFKEFGVRLAFTPTVLERRRISLRVRPEVSELSETGAIQIAGVEIPALATRRAETTVELASGQSLVIGGLISVRTRSELERFPLLGELPVLGPLFRSTRFRRNESELVILVTPYLVRPTQPQQLRTPTDAFAPSGRLERLLWGQLVRRQLPDAPRLAGPRLQGPAGFMLE